MNQNNNFLQLFNYIKEDRLRDTSVSSNRGILYASESDKGRVINSAAFRRLQQKAQVFPLDPNAAVRTRLTHSIEVSQVGRFIAQQVIKHFNCGNQFNYDQATSFVNVVETACLLHDIGNPPFGHLGEAAIREWFGSGMLPPLDDFTNYDGNPQGFRLISFLSGLDNFGLNLTCTQLLSILKYPWCNEDRPKHAKKIGLFSTDKSSYHKACEKLSWMPGIKFPFVYLMEAADDIAYSMSDLEDGLEKKIVSIEDIKNEFCHQSQEIFNKNLFDSTVVEPFINFKTHVISRAVTEAADGFCQHLEKILKTSDPEEKIEILDRKNGIGGLLKEINGFARKRIYSDVSAERVELAGRSVISGLLNHFSILLKLDETDFNALINEKSNIIKTKQLDFHIRLIRRLPEAYRKKYSVIDRGDESKRRAHLIVDFLSGMTDDFALETYQILQGIRIR